MRFTRPFFHPPSPPAKQRHVKAHVANIAPKRVEKPPWNIDFSIFAPRKRESDARDYYDNDRVNRKRLETDWKRTVKKSRFRKLVARADAGASADPSELEEELEEIKAALVRQYDVICRAFSYFCLSGQAIGESCYSMSLNQYSAFLQDAEIPDQSSKECKMKDLDTMFISTNFEDDKRDETAEVNDDLALMRFEFLEIFVRIAVAKYGKGQATDDVSDAVDILAERSIQPCLCPEAALDANVFRRERLYCEEVAEVLEGKQTELKAIYRYYKAKSRTKLMGMEDFVRCCDGIVHRGPRLTADARGVGRVLPRDEPPGDGHARLGVFQQGRGNGGGGPAARVVRLPGAQDAPARREAGAVPGAHADDVAHAVGRVVRRVAGAAAHVDGEVAGRLTGGRAHIGGDRTHHPKPALPLAQSAAASATSTAAGSALSARSASSSAACRGDTYTMHSRGHLPAAIQAAYSAASLRGGSLRALAAPVAVHTPKVSGAPATQESRPQHAAHCAAPIQRRASTHATSAAASGDANTSRGSPVVSASAALARA